MRILKIKLAIILLNMFTITFNIQSQCNCTTSVTNPSTTSEFGTTTTVSGYCKQITGTFTIDHNMEFINSNLDMQPNSQIIVNSGVTLKFTNTKTNNCTNWKGILLTDASSNIETYSNTQISGASIAIEAPLGGNINLIDTKMLNNYYTIKAEKNISINYQNVEQTRNASSTYGIYIFNPTNASLTINNSKFISVNSNAINISDGTMSSLNVNSSQFDGGFRSIQCKNIIGTKLIKNSKFINSTGYNIDFWGGNGGTVTLDTFDNCYGAVLAHDNENGAITINNNVIQNQRLGIWVYLNKSTATTTINLNKLYTMDSIGIICNGFAMGANPTTTINENILDYCNKGLLFENYTNASAVNNVLTLIRSKGIILNNTNNCSFTFNSLSASSLGVTEGFDLDMSMGNNINCNNTNYTYRGFHSNNTCGTTRLYNNHFGRHNTGLKIENLSYIGKQYDHYNTWLDTSNYYNLGAENLNPNQSFVLNSEFKVSSVYNTPLHPSNSGNGFFFVVLNNTPVAIKECQQTTPEEEERNSNLRIMIDPYSGANTPETETNKWESNRYLYQELKQHPNYQLQDATLASFANSQSNTNINSFYEVVKAISEGRYNDANSINNAINTTKIYEENLKVINNLFLQNGSYTTNQINTIYSIASQCPNTGGSAVFIARSLYRFHIDPSVSFDHLNCQTIQNRSSNSNISSIEVMPNPASNSIQLILNEKVENGILEILNYQGGLMKVIKDYNSTNLKELDIRELNSGMYILRITKNNQIIYAGKFVKIN